MYGHVAVFELDGTFVGYAVKEENNRTLQSTHLYREDEGEALAKRVAELNESQRVLGTWPDARDPDVVALVNNPNFEPIEYVENEVIDMDKSYLVYLKDADGEDTLEVDPEASVVVYRTAKVPARPSDYFERTKKACETVARQRLQSA